MSRCWPVILILLLCLWAAVAAADEQLTLPASTRPATPGPTANDAAEAGHLVVHGAVDLPIMRPVLEDFHRRYPDITLTYRNLTTLALHRRFLTTPGEADVVLSSAMPWQYHLVNGGHAMSLDTPAARAWPDWARWRRELFALTFEPIVMVIRREAVERFGRPDDHAELLDLLTRHSEALQGRVVTYDPARSGAGYTYAIEESRLSPRYWELVSALGQVEADLAETTGAMLAGLTSGRYLIGYNLLGSYVREAVAQDPSLIEIIPNDYALVIQRLAFIPRQAPHPVNARRFLDYLLSETGQRVLSERTPLGAIHPTLEGPGTAAALRRTHQEALHPVALSPGLLATLDDLKRQALLSRWEREFRRHGDPAPDRRAPAITAPR